MASQSVSPFAGPAPAFQAPSPGFAALAGIAPGLLLTAAISGTAYAVRDLPGVSTFSPMILAILIGIIFHNAVGTPRRAHEGVRFGLSRILRLAIILLGLQLTAQQVVAVGGRSFAIIVATVLATFVVTKILGRVLGVDRKLTELIAAGTSICGASAVIATNTVTRGSDEDVAYAVACVTIFGTIAMFADPIVGHLLALSPQDLGLWTGSSIHEVAQVVAAAFQDGPAAGQVGTVAKLSRVMLLAPIVLGLGAIASMGKKHPGVSGAKAPIPWFVMGFIAMIGINSLGVLPAGSVHEVALVTTFLLTMALASMGLETDIRKLRAKGLRPLALGAIASVFISGFSFFLIQLGGS